MFDNLIEQIQLAVQPKVVESNGHFYTSQDLSQLDRLAIKPLVFSSLTDFCYYAAKMVFADTEDAGDFDPLIIVKPDVVSLWTNLDNQGTRHLLAYAKPADFEFVYGNFYDREVFQIKLMQWFEQTEALTNILSFLSSVSTGEVVQLEDSGVSQSVTIKKEVLGNQSIKISPLVSLRPHPGYFEISSIARNLIFRMKREGSQPKFSLFSAGDALYSSELSIAIQDYLEQSLVDLECTNIKVLR